MKSIALFNNKGGVGKTTLSANVASHIALRQKKRVLVIDCDPQCNITQLVLGDDRTIDLYWNRGRKKYPEVQTLLDLVQPIMDGDASIDDKVTPHKAIKNRFGVDLIPGHPRFSNIEDPLSRAWGDLTATRIGGFRITHWLSMYLESIQSKYDYVFVDVGPSLGSLNRSVLVATEYFVTPLGSDVFSLLGIRNIAQWMDVWISDYDRSVSNLKKPDQDSLKKYGIALDLNIKNGYVGYTLQQYITKSKQGVRRATQAFERIIADVPDEIQSHMSSYFADGIELENSNLGDVPNLYSIIPLAQSKNAPIFDLKTRDGLVGAQYQQANRYAGLIEAVSNRIVENVS